MGGRGETGEEGLERRLRLRQLGKRMLTAGSWRYEDGWAATERLNLKGHHGLVTLHSLTQHLNAFTW